MKNEATTAPAHCDRTYCVYCRTPEQRAASARSEAAEVTVGAHVILDNSEAYYVAQGFARPQWIPAGPLTGTVQKVFKNGKVAVAIDQIRNGSADGLHTLNVPRARIIG
jgi:hypothetical protein